MFDRRLLQNFDWLLLLLLVILASTSLINLYSATHGLDGAGISRVFTRQIYWFLIGFGALLMMTLFDYHRLEQLAYPAYLLSLGLLVVVLVTGAVTSGSQRWISIGGVNLQPSELAKFAVILALAKFFAEHGEHRETYRLRDLWQPFLIIALPCALILEEPDLGTSLLLVIVSFSMVLFAGVRWQSLALLTSGFLAAAPFVWSTLEAYQKKRILTFLRPDMDPLGAGYHINQSKIAIGSGQLWGKGYLDGTQTRLHFLPEQHTDFAFSVLAEEWGFAGSMFLLTVYLLLIIWGINIAMSSRDRFGTFLAVGIMAVVFWELLINVCMATGLLPVVGIPLVLFSYGGSSVVSTMAGMGILMNISMRRFMFQ
ncbi:MAG: rod shape-determining protein RodA [Deltaproteobacteria bacterium]|nr:rod shape-determining protein RodA [Deltaproteobacteria bacterium]